MKIKLRKVLLSDARRFFEILTHPDFQFFPADPASIKEEKDFLRGLKKRINAGIEHSFAILGNGKIVGCVGVSINQASTHKCEIGFFVDRKHWGKGIAGKAIALLDEFIAENLDIVRIEIVMAKGNVGCQRVAIKAGYKKEGLMKKYLKLGNEFHDAHLYAKILDHDS
jgi:ribosomal-protein-alanine N-acetyltransferase